MDPQRHDRENMGNRFKEPTPEEKRVLRECQHESFFFRVLPLSAVGIVMTNYLIKQGRLTAHPRYGASTKYLGVIVASYIFGKISYMSTCRMKFLKLENSPIADMYRASISGQRNMYTNDPNQVRYSQREQQKEVEAVPFLYDRHMGDIDTERKEIKGLDDSQRPNVDSIGENQWPQQQQQQSFTTYEQLRQSHRSSKKVDDMAVTKTEPRKPVVQQEQTVEKVVKRNKYGDILE